MSKKKKETVPTPRYWQGRKGGHLYGYIRLPCEATDEEINRWVQTYGGLHLEYKDWVKKGGLEKEPYGSQSKSKAWADKKNAIYEFYLEGRQKHLKWREIQRNVNGFLAKRHWKELSLDHIRKIVRGKEIRMKQIERMLAQSFEHPQDLTSL